MEDLLNINIGAVVVAWLISIALGSFWYSPVGFGKLWSRLSGVDMMKMPKQAANKAIAAVAVASLIHVAVLALVIRGLSINGVANAVYNAFVLWLGLVAVTTIANTLYQRLSWKFWWLNSSFFLVVMVINSVLFTVWR